MRRVMPLVVVVVVMAFALNRVRFTGPSSDAWFHLRLGEEFLSTWTLREPGHLGAFDSADWVPTQWLSQMGMALAERAGGLDGVLLLVGVVQLLLILVIYLGCRATTGALAAATTTCLAFLAASIGLSARPQIMSYLLLAVLVLAWRASSRDGRVRWWLIALAWIWTPLHGMWPLATIVGAVCVAGIALDRTVERRQVARMALIPLLSAVVPALTPLGLGTYRAVALVGGRGDYFTEWGPTDFSRPYAVVLVVMLVVGVLHVARGRRSWLDLALVLLAAGWAIYSLRTVPVAAVIIAPVVADAIQRALPRGQRAPRLEVGFLAVAAVTVLLVHGVLLRSQPAATVVPPWVDQRLSALPARSGVLNGWAQGSYLLWRHPDLSFAMHGYGDVFTTAELDRNVDILELQPDWDRKVADLDADAAVIEVDSPLGYALSHDPDWTVVEADDDYVFLVPRD